MDKRTGRPVGRPATGRTPQRAVRVPDLVWTTAKKRAESEGKTISEVINDFLITYATARLAKHTGERVRDEVEEAQPRWKHLPPRPSREDVVETKAVEPSAVSAEPPDAPIVRREWGL